jgi:hypothetical protein
MAELTDKEFHDAIKKAVREVLHEMSRNVGELIPLVDAVRSAMFVIDNIPLTMAKGHVQLRADAIASARRPGLFIEFGVWKAYWINVMAKLFSAETFYGFDSFEGLPEAWSTLPKGHFSLGGNLPPVEPNVRLVKGWFDKTLPQFLRERPEPISFLHVDCDLYTSTMTALTLCRERLQVGTTIVLDDFMLEPGWASQEHKAFMDFCKANRIEFAYTGYSKESPSVSASVALTKV